MSITDKSKTAVTTQDCINTVKEVQGAIGFGPFTNALETELSVLKIDSHYPTDRDYPSAVTLLFVHKAGTVTPDAKNFIGYAKAEQGKNGPDQHGRRSRHRIRTCPAEGRGSCCACLRSVPG